MDAKSFDVLATTLKTKLNKNDGYGKNPWDEKMSNRRYELSDEQWERVKSVKHHSKMGRPPKDDRIMLNAMVWMARSGAGWEDLPERYGPWKTVYSRFCKWRDDGTFLHIFQALGEDADMENLSLDSTSVKAHQHSAGAKKGL